MRLYEKEERMRAACPGRDFIYFDEIDSTNTFLKNNIGENMPVAAADSQTAGRGRLGRSFFSRGGVYFSIPYVFSTDEKYASFLTLAASLAVRQSIFELTGAETLIKWPNDIYLDGCKICGILCESVVSGHTITVIAGIGVNIGNVRFPDDIKNRAGSLESGGFSADGEKLVCNTVKKLDDLVFGKKVLSENCAGIDGIVAELNRYSFTVGREVVYNEKKYTACAIDRSGALILRDSEGNLTKAVWGEVNISQ